MRGDGVKGEGPKQKKKAWTITEDKNTRMRKGPVEYREAEVFGSRKSSKKGEGRTHGKKPFEY